MPHISSVHREQLARPGIVRRKLELANDPNWAAVLLGGDADAYRATQGDVWDTQWDMFLALCGAITAQLTLSRVHGRQLGERLS